MVTQQCAPLQNGNNDTAQDWSDLKNLQERLCDRVLRADNDDNGSAYISVQNEVNNSHKKLYISSKIFTIQMKYQGLRYLVSKDICWGGHVFFV